MTAIISLSPQIPNSKDASGQSRAAGTAREAQTTLTRTQELDVAITTLEGDRFTLSSDSAASLLSGTYSRLDVTDSRLSKRELEFQAVAASNQAAATAVGDFSREEIRDIVKALRQILKIERDAGRGHLAQAVHRVEKLSKLDSLQSIEVSLELTTQVNTQSRPTIEPAPPDSAPAGSEYAPVPGAVSIEA